MAGVSKSNHWQLGELAVFLTAVTFLAMEHWENTKFCFKLGKTPQETYEVLQTVYGDDALGHCIWTV
jgi:hypothetical protein